MSRANMPNFNLKSKNVAQFNLFNTPHNTLAKETCFKSSQTFVPSPQSICYISQQSYGVIGMFFILVSLSELKFTKLF